MLPKTIAVTTNLPLPSWQSLAAMAAEDLREPGDFLHWLVHREAQRRGLMPPDGSTPEPMSRLADQASRPRLGQEESP